MGSNKVAAKATKTDKKSTKGDKKSKKVVEKVESSSESSSSSSESSESSDSSSSEDEEEVEEEKESVASSSEETNDKKRKAEDDNEEESSKIAKTEAPAAVFTVWCGGISWDANADNVKEFFSECGEVADVRIRLDNATGKNKGFCHIDFATKEAHDAALALTGTEFMGRTIRMDSAGDGTDRRAKKDENYGPKSTKVFVANLNRDYDEESHRAALTEAFSKFGTLVGDIRLPYNREEGTLRGIGYLEFETAEQADKAVKGMNGVDINGRPLRTDFSGSDDRDRVSGRGGRGGRGGGRGRGGDRGRGFGGGRGGGRGFSGGRGGGRGRGGY